VSRFDDGRWSRILIWTGAALAWVTAVIAAREAPAESSDPEPIAGIEQIQIVSPQPAIPLPPAPGLVVLRYTAVETPLPEVRTVLVDQQPATTSVAQAVPAPVSEGS